MGNVDKKFHHGRGEKACAANDQDGTQPPQTENHAAQSGAKQICQGVYHVYHRVALRQLVRSQQ